MNARTKLARLLHAAGISAVARVIATGGKCAHPRVVRYWFAQHRFARICKDCDLIIETGRDKSHRYPDDAVGVERGARVAT